MSFVHILSKPPHAIARIKGSVDYPEILGITRFFQANCGMLVATETTGLPYLPGSCEHFIFAFHIHEGYALSIFLTNRFRVEEIIGRTIVIHASPDDFKTQPAGNAGEKIACGVIKPS